MKSSGQSWAYRLQSPRMFSGTPTTYREKTAARESLSDPMGGYHGIAVKRGRETFVMCGPKCRFIPEPDTAANAGAAQLSLFGGAA